MENGKMETHESYGMLQFNRTMRGGDTVLFGSSITHRDTISLTISPAKVERSLHNDWYYKDGREYIQVEMSQSQFAEAISSMGMGSGVPVTVRRLNGKGMEEPDFVNKRIQFEKEFEEKMRKLEGQLSTLTKEAEDVLTNKKSINKADRQLILNQLASFKRELASNIPFMASSYNEQLDKTTQEVKAEMDAYTLNRINQLGLSKLGELKELSDKGLSGEEKKLIE